MKKRIASLSLDLDNKWSYLQNYGDPRWKQFPSYLDLVVPRILKFLSKRNLRITFFVVGQDAAMEEHRGVLRSIVDGGHEIANHTFRHNPWLHLYSKQEIESELVEAEEAILDATGCRPDGFRGPGFSISSATLRVLHQRGYKYDASSFPNILNPLARAYFLMKSNLTKEQRQKRKALYGSWTDAFRPVKPYLWAIGNSVLREIPVTTMPVFRLPMHFSYLLFLYGYSKSVAMLYWRVAIMFCQWTNTEPSLLLHPLDFMGGDDDRDLSFFPGMNLTHQDKSASLGEMFRILCRSYDLLPVGEHARRIEAAGRFNTTLNPKFRHSS